MEERRWDNPLFEIFVLLSNGGHDDTAYASDAGGAFAAFHQLHRDRGIMGTKVCVKNLETGKVVWIG